MTDCPPHHYLLRDPVAGRVPGTCKQCGAERDWPAFVGLLEGRPMLVNDPLPPRSLVDGRSFTNWTN